MSSTTRAVYWFSDDQYLLISNVRKFQTSNISSQYHVVFDDIFRLCTVQGRLIFSWMIFAISYLKIIVIGMQSMNMNIMSYYLYYPRCMMFGWTNPSVNIVTPLYTKNYPPPLGVPVNDVEDSTDNYYFSGLNVESEREILILELIINLRPNHLRLVHLHLHQMGIHMEIKPVVLDKGLLNNIPTLF